MVIKHPNLHLGEERHLFHPECTAYLADLAATEPQLFLEFLLYRFPEFKALVVNYIGYGQYIGQQFLEIDVALANQMLSVTFLFVLRNSEVTLRLKL
jgi:hypothetical protein